MKQDNCCLLVLNLSLIKWMTYSARGDVVELGRPERSQSNDGSDGEGLHFD